MNKLTKTLSIVGLATAVLFSSMGGASAAAVHYKDVNKADNFYNSVDYLLEKNAISSTLPNFRPYENITRGQFASIFGKVLDLDVTNVENPNFKDVPTTHQFYKYVSALENEGIIGGKADGTFGINDPLTRGQMAGILAKAYDIPAIDTTYYKGKASDIYSGTYFKGQWGDELGTLETLGIMSGFGDDSFKPNAPIKRSQFANMLVKMEHANINDFEYDNIIKSFRDLGVSEKVAYEKIKSLKDTDTMRFLYQSTDMIQGDYDVLLSDKYVFEFKKEGEILFEDINVKLVVTNDSEKGWSFTAEEIALEPTTNDTATVETTDAE